MVDEDEYRSICSKTFLNQPSVGPTLSEPFREVVGFRELEYLYGRSFGTEIKRYRRVVG